MDTPVLAVAGAIALATVLLFGLLPASRSTRQNLAATLRTSAPQHTPARGLLRVRGTLVVAEVALSLVLVTGAGLLLRSFLRVQAQDVGFDAERLWVVPLAPTGFPTPDDYLAAMDRVEASLATLPGVTSAAYSLTVPFQMTGQDRCCSMTSGVTLKDGVRQGLPIILQPVTETYLQTLGIPLRAGRGWQVSEVEDQPQPIVLSEALAVQLFGSAEAAVGEELTPVGQKAASRVVGVAGDAPHFGLDQDLPLFIYYPMERIRFAMPMATMVVRVDREVPESWARTVRARIWAAAPNLPVPAVQSMDDWIKSSTAGRRFDSSLFGTLGALALFLAAAGLYGTLLYTVGQRRREIGIRLALGASRNEVVRRVVLQGLALAAAGCVLGLGGTLALGSFLESRLFELEATDPVAIAGAMGILLAVASFASWLPARRAGGTDPLDALRAE